MKTGLVIVAHPDDETLWFSGIMRLHSDIAWTIACVTYTAESPRGQDFRRVCRQIPADGILFGFLDTPGPLVDESELEIKLVGLLQQQPWDVVLTHNLQGEYGHVHHRQVHRLVQKHFPQVVFSGFGNTQIDAQVCLPAPVFAWKKRLFDLYTADGKGNRMQLYPPYAIDCEPLVTMGNPVFSRAEHLPTSVAWEDFAGPKALASRRAIHTRRIALLADVPGWAHAIIAHQLQRVLPPELELEIHYLYSPGYEHVLPLKLDVEQFDLIHLLSWRHWSLVEQFHWPRHKLVTTVHGHRALEKLDELAECFAGISVVSRRLLDELHARVPGIAYTPCGVDTQLFVPFSRCENRVFTYGAAGRFYQDDSPDDIKGWHTVLEPLRHALLEYQACYIKTDHQAPIPYADMPAFYQGCDCFLCASQTEGNPLPLLEAASCGLPLLSTPVGIATEIIDATNGFILERNAHSFAAAVRELAQDEPLRRKMGENSRRKVLQDRDWSCVSPYWLDFYQSAL
jgi:glycosyltransferase involved in cell wall biosynthesis